MPVCKELKAISWQQWSCYKRIFIYSVEEKMNLIPKISKVDKRRSGLEGGGVDI